MSNQNLQRLRHRIAFGWLIVAGSMPFVRAQSKPQKFEVASIHKCSSNAVVPLREGGGLGDIGPSPNRVTKECVTVLALLQDAFVIFADGQNRSSAAIQMPPIEKAPAWISSDLYTVDAKADGAPGQSVMLGPMMQSLLEDRFHLKLHLENRSGAAYELTVAKGGPRLRINNGACSVDVPPAAVPRDSKTGRPLPGFAGGRVSPPSQPEVPCRLMLNFRNGQNQLFISSATTIDRFCSYLSRVTGRMVVDQTGLRDKYDCSGHWSSPH